MRQIGYVLLLTGLLLPGAVRAQQPADFSGVWEMDRTRSASALQAAPIGPVTLLIQQTPAELKVETQRKEKSNAAASSETLTFKLDGSENVTTVKSGVEVKAKARWEGAKLITETVRNVQGSTVTTMHTYSLDPGGKELTIEKTLTVQHGYQFPGAQNTGSGQDIFVKRRGPAQK